MEISGFGLSSGRILKESGKCSSGTGFFKMGFIPHHWTCKNGHVSFRLTEIGMWIQVMLFLAVHLQTN